MWIWSSRSRMYFSFLVGELFDFAGTVSQFADNLVTFLNDGFFLLESSVTLGNLVIAFQCIVLVCCNRCSLRSMCWSCSSSDCFSVSISLSLLCDKCLFFSVHGYFVQLVHLFAVVDDNVLKITWHESMVMSG